MALIPPFLIQQELAQGALAVLNPHSGPGQRAFHLIVPERKATLPALAHFRDWLVGRDEIGHEMVPADHFMPNESEPLASGDVERCHN